MSPSLSGSQSLPMLVLALRLLFWFFFLCSRPLTAVRLVIMRTDVDHALNSTCCQSHVGESAAWLVAEGEEAINLLTGNQKQEPRVSSLSALPSETFGPLSDRSRNSPDQAKPCPVPPLLTSTHLWAPLYCCCCGEEAALPPHPAQKDGSCSVYISRKPTLLGHVLGSPLPVSADVNQQCGAH